MNVWKEIIKETVHLKPNSIFEVGKGDGVRIWEDSWCTETPFCELFHSLFALAGTKRLQLWRLPNR